MKMKTEFELKKQSKVLTLVRKTEEIAEWTRQWAKRDYAITKHALFDLYCLKRDFKKALMLESNWMRSPSRQAEYVLGCLESEGLAFCDELFVNASKKLNQNKHPDIPMLNGMMKELHCTICTLKEIKAM